MVFNIWPKIFFSQHLMLHYFFDVIKLCLLDWKPGYAPSYGSNLLHALVNLLCVVDLFVQHLTFCKEVVVVDCSCILFWNLYIHVRLHSLLGKQTHHSGEGDLFSLVHTQWSSINIALLWAILSSLTTLQMLLPTIVCSLQVRTAN